MPTLVVKTNASQATDVQIDDLGWVIPSSGGSATFTELDALMQAQRSEDLLALATDDAFGAGSSTLILNDGASDVAQTDAETFLLTFLLPRTGAYSVPVRDSVGLETVQAASETVAGKVEIATQGETDTGTDDARAVTPLKLATTTVAGIDSDAIHDNVAGEIAAVTEKVTPVSGDLLLIEDSAAANAKKRVQVGNLPGGGASNLDDLSDVDVTTLAPSDGDLLRYNGTTWVVVKNNVTTTAPTVNDDSTANYSVGSRWIDTAADKEYVCLDASSGAAVWTETTQGGGTDTTIAFSGVDSTGGTNVAGAWVDIPLDTELKKTSEFAHTNPSAEVTVNETATLAVLGYASALITSGNARSQCEIRLMRDTGGGYVEVSGTRGQIYQGRSSHGGTAGFKVVLDVTSGDKFKLEMIRSVGSSTVELTADGSGLAIVALKGEKGDPGPGGTTVLIEDESSPVGGGSFDTLDFAGAGVTVTDGGGGTATVTIPGGGGGTAKETVRFVLNGRIEVVSRMDGTWVAPATGTINKVTLHRQDEGSSGSTIIDVNKNGVTIFTTQGNRPEVTSASGADVIDKGVPDVTSIAEDDRITVDIDQIESGNPLDLSVTLDITFS